ncbi:MAG: glycosyltransferase family 1 protein [Vicinamibacterales bacterium]
MQRSSQLRIVVTGLIAQHPVLGGVAWDYLQYPLGLSRLGHDVHYFEDSGEWPYRLDGGPTGDDWVAWDCSANIAHLKSVMLRIGMADRWAYRFPIEDRWFGLSDAKRNEVLRTADLFINVSGSVEHPERYQSIPHTVYIDSDPGFTQARIALGDSVFADRVARHRDHFSFGEMHSRHVPATSMTWRPTRQPIVMDQWSPSADVRNVYTTVMSWTSYKPLEYGGLVFGQKDLEFRKFVDLPIRMPSAHFEVALGRTEHANWSADSDVDTALPRLSTSEILRRKGWATVDAFERCGSVDAYRDYIQSSKAEWSIAKNGYVVAQAGWFSCRSACYLAAGRPVVVQDTGFTPVIPVGRGLFRFSTVEEAVDAIREVEQDYVRHSKAAREIAEGYFNATDVLRRLIDDCFARDVAPTTTNRARAGE